MSEDKNRQSNLPLFKSMCPDVMWHSHYLSMSSTCLISLLTNLKFISCSSEIKSNSKTINFLLKVCYCNYILIPSKLKVPQQLKTVQMTTNK